MKTHYLFLLLIIPLSLAGCGNRKVTEGDQGNAVPVILKKAQYISAKKEISVSGNVEGNKTVKLGFMVAGKINYIAAEEGNPIKKGELLASLDPERYSIANDIAEADLAQTQDDYNRLSRMYKQKSISESDFSKITNALKVAKAKQRLQAKDLSDTRLYSPIRGVLLKKGTEVGEIIGVGIPLFVVSDIYTVKVNAAVPESELRFLKLGGKARVEIYSLDSTLTGKIVEIGAIADPVSRTFSVKVELDNPDLLIRPGMTAGVKFLAGKKTKFIAVPAEAVLHDLDNSSYLFVADTVKKQAFKRIITLGRITGEEIEVTSGLNTNDLVVVGGQHKLSNGSSILIK